MPDEDFRENNYCLVFKSKETFKNPHLALTYENALAKAKNIMNPYLVLAKKKKKKKIMSCSPTRYNNCENVHTLNNIV